MNVLITSGGTIVPIDDVRRIANMSSGKFGSNLAKAFLLNKIHTIHLHSKGGISPFNISLDLMKYNMSEINKEIYTTHNLFQSLKKYYDEYIFQTFEQYQASLKCLLEQKKPDVTILSAAVSDYGMDTTPGKISSSLDEITFKLKKLPKIINKIKEWHPSTFLVGFKLLSGSKHDDLIESAIKLEKQSDADLIVANDLNDLKSGNHRLYLIKNGDILTVIDKNLEFNLRDFIYREATSLKE